MHLEISSAKSRPFCWGGRWVKGQNRPVLCMSGAHLSTENLINESHTPTKKKATYTYHSSCKLIQSYISPTVHSINQADLINTLYKAIIVPQYWLETLSVYIPNPCMKTLLPESSVSGSILWDAITYPWLRYLLLVPKFLYVNICPWNIMSHLFIRYWQMLLFPLLINDTFVTAIL